MRIEKVEISNWRSIKQQSLFIEDFAILIGQNNHGKSNILSAILFFFGEIPLDPLDYHNHCSSLYVEIKFGSLDEDDKVTFKKYLDSEGKITVRRVAEKGQPPTYHGFVKTPVFPWLSEDNVSDYLTRAEADKLPLKKFLPTSGRITKDIFQKAQEDYIAENNDKLSFITKLENSPFLGAKNVAKGIFGEVYFVPSVKKACDDFSAKGKTIFSELYSRVINKMSESNEEFKNAKETIRKLTQILNKNHEDGSMNKNRPPELTDLENVIQEELASWQTTIDVEITPPNLDDIFRVGTNVWVDDGIRTDINRKGQGLQRALIFALVKSLAKLTRLEASNSSEEKVSRKASKTSYFILEEPELFLHPQAQRELFESLVDLSKVNNQIIVCTHSAAFLSLEYYKSITIIRKPSIEVGTTIFQFTQDLFPDVQQKNIFNMTYWINPDRGELFFSKKVVLVEGATDKTIIPHLATTLGCFRHDFTLLDCGSKDNIPNYVHLLNCFSIPYTVVFDKDNQSHKQTDAIDLADKVTAKIKGTIDENLGKVVILENDIEEEIGIPESDKKNKPYVAIAFVKRSEYQIPESLAEKIKEIYAE
jgi:CRISPR-associated exonuclease Cas4